MASIKGFISFWGTFPGVLTGGAVLMVGTGVVIWVASALQPATLLLECMEFQRGREDQVACNALTDRGFFWSLAAKTEHYSVEGVSPVGRVPSCGPRTVGNRAMSARFPLRDVKFLPVRASYKNKHPDLVAPGCNFTEAGEKKTDRDLGETCGLFAFECNEQP